MANIRFAVGIQRLIPFLGYHHILMIMIALAIILLCTYALSPYHTPRFKLTHPPTALLLAGCSSSSPLIPGIFLVSFFYVQGGYTPAFSPAQVNPGITKSIAELVGSTCLEVRVGYFGICITYSDDGFLCSNNATLLAQQIAEVQQDPLNLIWVASTYKNLVVFPYLL